MAVDHGDRDSAGAAQRPLAHRTVGAAGEQPAATHHQNAPHVCAGGQLRVALGRRLARPGQERFQGRKHASDTRRGECTGAFFV